MDSYYEKNKEKIKERSKLWRLNNPNRVKQNNTKFKQSKIDYVKNNPHKRKESIIKYNRKFHEPRKPRGKCSICEEPHSAKGYCQIHYNNLKRYGDPIHIQEVKKCSVDDCLNKYYCSGFCKHHYNRSEVRKESNKSYENTHRKQIRKRRSTDEFRSHISEYNKKYKKENPEKRLEISKRHFEKYSNIFKLSDKKYKWSLEAWSKAVKTRDDFTCQICGSKENLHSHHIFYKAKHPELSLNVNNGITLCKQHHYETHGLTL